MNNRTFEALAAGSIVISEPFEYLEEHPLGDFIHFAGSEDEVRDLLTRAQQDPEMKRHALAGQQYVLEHHTYVARARDFINLFQEVDEG